MESKRVYEAETDHRMVSCDLEAAETLAGLARGSSLRGEASGPPRTSSGYPSQDQAIAVQQFCGNTTAVVTGVLETNETVSIVPSHLCSTSYPSNSTSKLRQNLTEAEKQERRVRRILANRESARQTIRRRQATYLEFTKKAADLAEQNESLKKEKELAVKEYNSLKDRNAYLKLQMSKLKEAESRETREEPRSSEGGSSSATMSTPFLPSNQPVLVPLLWPSVVPSSNVFQWQCASHPDISSVQQGQENCSAIAGSGNPLFVLPVPLLLPCLSHGNAPNSHFHTTPRPNETSSPCRHSIYSSSDYHQPLSPRNTRLEASNPAKAVPSGSSNQYVRQHHHAPLDLNLRPRRHSQVDETDDLNNVSAPKHISHLLSSKKNQETVTGHHRKLENVIEASKARGRRKELMRLKKIHLHYPDLHRLEDRVYEGATKNKDSFVAP